MTSTNGKYTVQRVCHLSALILPVEDNPKSYSTGQIHVGFNVYLMTFQTWQIRLDVISLTARTVEQSGLE